MNCVKSTKQDKFIGNAAHHRSFEVLNDELTDDWIQYENAIVHITHTCIQGTYWNCVTFH